jgi:hypothetical protein
MAAAVEAIAGDLPGMDRVDVRPATQSVVFRYSLEDTDPAAFRAALEARAAVSDGRDAPLPVPVSSRPLGEQLIHQVRRWWLEADRQVLQATGGAVDLRSSVPWILLFLALRQLIVNRQLGAMPWYTAFYYSLQAILRYPADEEPAMPDEGVTG